MWQHVVKVSEPLLGTQHTRAAFYAAGVIIEPYALSPGNHTAAVIFLLDLGGEDIVEFPLLVNLMVHGV